MMRNVANVSYELSPNHHNSHKPFIVFYKVAIFILLFAENVIYLGACSTFPFSTLIVCLRFFMSRKCSILQLQCLRYIRNKVLFFCSAKLISSIFHGVFHSSFNSLSPFAVVSFGCSFRAQGNGK